MRDILSVKDPDGRRSVKNTRTRSAATAQTGRLRSVDGYCRLLSVTVAILKTTYRTPSATGPGSLGHHRSTVLSRQRRPKFYEKVQCWSSDNVKFTHKPRKPLYNPRSFKGTRSDMMMLPRDRIPPPPAPWIAGTHDYQ